MNKIVISRQNPQRGKRSLKVRSKKVRDSQGNITSIPTLDSNDPDFGLKLEKIFQQNVAKALGQSDGKKRRRAAPKS